MVTQTGPLTPGAGMDVGDDDVLDVMDVDVVAQLVVVTQLGPAPTGGRGLPGRDFLGTRQVALETLAVGLRVDQGGHGERCEQGEHADRRKDGSPKLDHRIPFERYSASPTIGPRAASHAGGITRRGLIGTLLYG